MVRDAGGVEALVRLVRGGSDTSQAVLRLAADALRLLAEPPAQLPRFRSDGGVGALIYLCSCGWGDVQVHPPPALSLQEQELQHHH